MRENNIIGFLANGLHLANRLPIATPLHSIMFPRKALPLKESYKGTRGESIYV